MVLLSLHGVVSLYGNGLVSLLTVSVHGVVVFAWCYVFAWKWVSFFASHECTWCCLSLHGVVFFA